jgi:glycosyltransferase involved in cell wall biosynthesis
LGLQTNPYTFVNQADVYVQTSILEGFCLTVREAKLLSKPIVSTNFPAIYNQLNHEVNGLIAEMNYMSVADNICRVVSDESLKKLIIENLQLENLKKTQDDVFVIEKVFC